MSSKTEIKCLIALQSKVDCLKNIIEFLSKENVIDLKTVHQLSTELNMELPYAVHRTLMTALKNETLQLVDYHWTKLPKETIMVSIVTMHSHKDFTWNC